MNDLLINPDEDPMKRPADAAQRDSFPKLISFSGVDGAGKSTQIEALCAAIQDAGMKFRIIRFWDDVARLVRFREAASVGVFKSDTGVGAPGAPVNRRDKNVRSWYMTCVRLGLYTVDAVSLQGVIREALRSGCEVVIFDRFIFDELANLNLKNSLVRIYIRLVLALVRKPDISFVLDADPVQARARKPEYPLEFLYVSRESYLTLSRMIDGITVIAPKPMEEVKREILRHGAGLFSGKDRQYVA
ncbi:MAG TPA: thymidylate kinase [Terracidiphilus sp.]|nr:thymidylate kinase [Terracidiphilus sp.]